MLQVLVVKDVRPLVRVSQAGLRQLEEHEQVVLAVNFEMLRTHVAR